ncbi:MAG: PIN domain-containing protein [Candidatus Lokiarchaeota archaeon]|nr:PIN domain-containing protein [Candidatus Lokiarchaeota archaeon]
MKVCIDSNVFIAVKNKEPSAHACERILDAIENNRLHGVVSTIVLSEVEVGFYLNNEASDAQAFAVKVRHDYSLVPVSDDIAIEAARIRADTGMRLPDALISATALASACDFLISSDIPMMKQNRFHVIDPETFVKNHLS